MLQQAPVISPDLFCQAYARKLPAIWWIEEITIAWPQLCRYRHAGAATQHPLIAHKLAIVFTDRAGAYFKAWIRSIGRSRPLPAAVIELYHAWAV